MPSSSGDITFVANAKSVATRAMRDLMPELAEKYTRVIEFLAVEPEMASSGRGRAAPKVGSVEYIERQAMGFVQGRIPKSPEPPSTIPDPMVSVILNSYWRISTDELDRITREHQLSMASENIVGAMLEHYIADVAEDFGWIWCSGELVKHVDFVKPPTRDHRHWRMLQIKNRDNSENSSSSLVRSGTSIEKWYRTKSRTGATMWNVFPDDELRSLLSESGFEKFAKQYLRASRTADS
jgi:hypothetical protein